MLEGSKFFRKHPATLKKLRNARMANRVFNRMGTADVHWGGDIWAKIPGRGEQSCANTNRATGRGTARARALRWAQAWLNTGFSWPESQPFYHHEEQKLLSTNSQRSFFKVFFFLRFLWCGPFLVFTKFATILLLLCISGFFVSSHVGS